MRDPNEFENELENDFENETSKGEEMDGIFILKDGEAVRLEVPDDVEDDPA